MTAAEALADLDAALTDFGRDVVLRRAGAADLTVRASVRARRSEELTGNIAQAASDVVLSPSDVAAAGWPGGEVPGPTVEDPSLPRRGDKVVIDGRPRHVEFVNPIVIDDTLVRIELIVIG